MSDLADERFEAYVVGLAEAIGHADREKPLRDYCAGLMLPMDRKSVEPLAAATLPSRVSAQHQSLMHFISQSAWSDEKLLAKVRELVLPKIEAHGAIEAWIIDDTAFRKKGHHSVGVARQYCGEVGKQDNCQVAVSLSLANGWASLPVAFRLYLPKQWADDAERRRKAKVPADIAFASKPKIALHQLSQACAQGLPRGVVVMDPGYGNDAELRLGLQALGLSYIAGILPNSLVFDPKADFESDRPPPRRGRRGEFEVTSAKEVALALEPEAWRTVAWREGSAEVLSSRFARVRLHSAHPYETPQGRAEEWLLIEWPEGESEPSKYWLSTVPKDMAFERLVELAKLRLHHHATLAIAAYGFLIQERETIPPSGAGRSRTGAPSHLPADYRPRGSATQAGTPYPQLNRYHAPAPHRSNRLPRCPCCGQANL
jgi:SRSO17 transposase